MNAFFFCSPPEQTLVILHTGPSRGVRTGRGVPIRRHGNMIPIASYYRKATTMESSSGFSCSPASLLVLYADFNSVSISSWDIAFFPKKIRKSPLLFVSTLSVFVSLCGSLILHFVVLIPCCFKCYENCPLVGVGFIFHPSLRCVEFQPVHCILCRFSFSSENWKFLLCHFYGPIFTHRKRKTLKYIRNTDTQSARKLFFCEIRSHLIQSSSQLRAARDIPATLTRIMKI